MNQQAHIDWLANVIQSAVVHAFGLDRELAAIALYRWQGQVHAAVRIGPRNGIFGEGTAELEALQSLRQRLEEHIRTRRDALESSLQVLAQMAPAKVTP